MKLPRGWFTVAGVLATTLVATSCSHLPKMESDKVDYKSAGELPPLEVPPDLVRPATDDRYAIPGAAPQQNAATSPYATMAKGDDGAQLLVVDDPFDRAWRRIGLALDRSGITVNDRDREKGIYQVRYTDPDAEKPGFFSRLFGKKKDAAEQYQVLVKEVAKGSQVSVLDKDGKADKSDTAGRLLAKLYDQLK